MFGHLASQRLERTAALGERAVDLVFGALVVQVILHLLSRDLLDPAVAGTRDGELEALGEMRDLVRFAYLFSAELATRLVLQTVRCQVFAFGPLLVFQPATTGTLNNRVFALLQMNLNPITIQLFKTRFRFAWFY